MIESIMAHPSKFACGPNDTLAASWHERPHWIVDRNARRAATESAAENSTSRNRNRRRRSRFAVIQGRCTKHPPTALVKKESIDGSADHLRCCWGVGGARYHVRRARRPGGVAIAGRTRARDEHAVRPRGC